MAASAPQEAEAALRRGEALIDARRYREAMKVLRPAVEKLPGDPWLRCALSEALLQSNHAREALEHAQAAEQIVPQSPRALQMVGEAQLELGHFDEARLAAQRMVELSPHAAGGYDLRGRIGLRTRHFADAEVNFREAVRLQPGNWALNNNLGVALRHLKREREAVDAFERAVKADPSATLARKNLFRATSAFQTWGGFIAAVVVLRILASNAGTFHIPVLLAEGIFFGGVIVAALASWLWARHRRRRLSPLVNNVYEREWLGERALYVLRYLFRATPVALVVLAVLYLGFSQHVGYLPWIVAGGVFVVAWWFAWRPAWRRVVAFFDRS